jgi:hypothetical protein
MKFLSLALAAVLSFADAKLPFTNKDIQQKLKSGQLDKKTLMAKAVPYNRKLNQNQNQYGITSDYSVSFGECVTLKMKDNNLLADGFVDYTKSGHLLSEKSYVVFTMCPYGDCSTAMDGDYSYIVDIDTFITALSWYLPTKKENYCNQCERNMGYCDGSYAAAVAEAEAAQAEADAAEAEGAEAEGEQDAEGEQAAEGGGRRLSTYIDCDLCNEYECFAVNDDDAAADELINYDNAYDYITGLINCQDTGLVQDDMALYAGLICNSDGTGVEVGVFLDNACTLYTTSASFSSILTSDDTAYLEKASELITYMFTTDIPCLEDRTEYTNPYDEGEEHEQNNENQNLGEWCNDLFNGEAVQSLSACEAEENDDVNNDDNADAWTAVNYYTWDLTFNDAEEAAKTCYVVQQWGGDYKSHHVYNTKQSGSVFDYSQGKKKSGGGKGAIVAIVIILLLVAAAGLYWAFQGKAKADKKRTPLINGAAAGSMA